MHSINLYIFSVVLCEVFIHATTGKTANNSHRSENQAMKCKMARQMTAIYMPYTVSTHFHNSYVI